MGRLVDAARLYVGVKYRHRGRSHHGIDCAGLLVLAFADCGVPTTDFVMYGREPFNDGLVTRTTAALGEPLPAGTPLQDGDVVLLRFAVQPHHMGILAAVTYAGTPAFNIIHADGHTGRVLEQRMSPDVHARISHVYRKGVL